MPDDIGSDPGQRAAAFTCPFCSHSRGIVHRLVRVEEAATQAMRRYQDPKAYDALVSAIENVWQSSTCSIIRCEACDGFSSQPHKGGDSAVYNLAYKHAYGYPSHRWEWDLALEQLQREVTTPRALLDVGAGEGAWEKLLLSAGFDPAALWSVEYGDRARNTIHALSPNITVLPDMDSVPADSYGNFFDAVCAFQVVEHLSCPVNHLTHFRYLLRPGGLLFVSVPNPARIEFSERNGLLEDMPPYHVSRLGSKAFQVLAERSGFEIDRIVLQPYAMKEAGREFLAYHYKRRTQFEASLQSRAERHLPRPIATGIGALLALPSAIRYMPGRSDGATLLCVLRNPSG